MRRFLILYVLVIAACGWTLANTVLAESLEQSGEGSHKLVQALREQLIQDVELVDESDLIWLDLRRFYTERRFQPLWFTDAGLNERAQQLLKVLETADQQGLNPEDYNLCFFRRHCDDEKAAQRVWVELLLTKSLMLYIEHMQRGRLSPHDMGLDWYIDRPQVNVLDWLQETVDAPDFEQALTQLQPPYEGYRRLQSALLNYLDLQASGGWPAVPEGPTLQLWDSHGQLPVIRERLQAEGDLQVGPVENALLFDETVKLAVEHFQVRYGVDVDGIVGPRTRAAMNVPIAERIRQIQFNLERWRWLPRELGGRYILVNTAGHELVVYEFDRPRFVMRVITGMPDRPTPALSGPLQSIEFNPYWHIPRRIALEDVIPQQRRNPNFFRAMGIRVLKNHGGGLVEVPASGIDWARVDSDHFPYLLRQDPGSHNSLGRIKIKFANDFALYLHDTPKQRLFQRGMRAFSSGCIRVENAIDLAEYLLQDQNGWTKAHIQEVIDSGQTVTVDLATEIPMYLAYWTAWVSSDEHVYFRRDVYGWDRSQSQCQ